jgi:serine/threonine protein kinase
MPSSRQQRIREVFDAARLQPAQSQAEFVSRECRNEGEVEEVVLKLLRAANQSGEFLNQSMGQRREPALDEGSCIGAYKILRELGAGGMGVVYLTARADQVFDRVSALKLIHPAYKSPPLLHRFQQEREILARLDHPNIARIIDGGTTTGGLPYFVMDYVDGLPIDKFCKQRQANLTQRLNLFRQACSAVEYLHSQGIVHRDLKPANVLVTAGGVVKLLDFGIAKVLDQNAADVTTMPLMTIGYASPEQLAGGPTGPAADIYSLGVILYELLTGARPHDVAGKAAPEIIRLISEAQPVRPSRRVEKDDSNRVHLEPGSLKGDLDMIVLMALRREPERRYPSAAEFAADIERFQSKRPVKARKNSVAYVSSRFMQRQAKAIMASVLIAASFSLVTWEVAKHYYQAQANKGPEVIQQLSEREQQRHGQGENFSAVQTDLDTLSTYYQHAFGSPVARRFVSASQRRQVLGDGLSYLQRMSREATANRDSAAALAGTFLTVAETQKMDDPGEARSTCETALRELGPALVRFADPKNPQEYSANLARRATRLGDLLRSPTRR